MPLCCDSLPPAATCAPPVPASAPAPAKAHARRRPRAAHGTHATLNALTQGLALAGALGLAPGAQAGVLAVRDVSGLEWRLLEDSTEDHEGWLLRRLTREQKADTRFARTGTVAFTLGPDNENPNSLRVEAATQRVWVVGSTGAGGHPQPVIMRFNPDGSPDTRWGVQGRLTYSVLGAPTRPVDVLPLSDGSVLVAGEAPGQGQPRAVVFKLKADGTADTSFGNQGVWFAPAKEGALAAALAVGADGTVVVGVIRRAATPIGEVWALGDRPPSVLAQQELADNIDEDESRIEGSGTRWSWQHGPGVAATVPPAQLSPPAAASAPASATDTGSSGGGAFNPFSSGGAPAASGSSATNDTEDGTPWGVIGLAAALVIGLGLVFLRKR